MKVLEFLEEKPLYYSEIDYTRMPRVYHSIKEYLHIPKIIHLVGTNAKGTTGRFLATALHRAGYKTGHYTSPHIIRFHERIWIDGRDVLGEELESAHETLLKLLSLDDAKSLSYFEYTTLLAMVVFQECEYVVLEAGLGGEHDATAVFDNILTIITPIDKDHEAFLGETIDEIAQTKLKAVQKRAVIAPQHHPDVYKQAQSLQKHSSFKIIRVEKNCLKFEQIATKIAQEEHFASYIRSNLLVAMVALEELGIDVELEYFTQAKLFGRLTQLQPNILLDVGHNTLAAQALVEALQPNKYTLVYNSYKDKDYQSILSILQEIIDDVEILPLENERIEDQEIVEKSLESLGMKYTKHTHIDDTKNYLVFGSFSVVEKFLEVYHG